MEEEIGRWAELMPETLGLIFSRLSLKEVLTVVPAICKSWERVVKGPYCWEKIGIEGWCSVSTPEKVDRMVRLIVNRSGGNMRELYVSGLSGDLILSFIADNAWSLQTLRLSNCDMSDEGVERAAEKLSCLTSLDLRNCWGIGARGLEAFGKNCKKLSFLKRLMGSENRGIVTNPNEEARAIAGSMPNLKELELEYYPRSVETPAVMEIIDKCLNLEFLDVSGCCDLRDRNKEIGLKFPNLKIELLCQCDSFGEFDDYDDFNDDLSSFDGEMSESP